MTTALPWLLYSETDVFDYMWNHTHTLLPTRVTREPTTKPVVTSKLAQHPLHGHRLNPSNPLWDFHQAPGSLNLPL